MTPPLITLSSPVIPAFRTPTTHGDDAAPVPRADAFEVQMMEVANVPPM